MGIRLQGPKPQFARSSGGEGGSHPSNVHDHVYALGTINYTGALQAPLISQSLLLTFLAGRSHPHPQGGTVSDAQQWPGVQVTCQWCSCLMGPALGALCVLPQSLAANCGKWAKSLLMTASSSSVRTLVSPSSSYTTEQYDSACMRAILKIIMLCNYYRAEFSVEEMVSGARDRGREDCRHIS